MIKMPIVMTAGKMIADKSPILRPACSGENPDKISQFKMPDDCALQNRAFTLRQECRKLSDGGRTKIDIGIRISAEADGTNNVLTIILKSIGVK